jgi:hypothetical protein
VAYAQAVKDFDKGIRLVVNELTTALGGILANLPTDAAEPVVMANELLLLQLIGQALITKIADFTPLIGLLVPVIHWLAGLAEMRCADTTPTSSDLLAAYGIEAQGLSRSEQLVANEQDVQKLQEATTTCFSRLKYAVTFDDTEVETIPTFKVSIDVTASPALENPNSGTTQLVTGSGDFDFHSESVTPTSPNISNVVVTHTGGALGLLGVVKPTTSLGCVNHVLTITRSAQLVINPQMGIKPSDVVDWTFDLHLNSHIFHESDTASPVNEWQAFTVASWPPAGPPQWVITLASDGTKWKKPFNFVAGAGTGVVDFSAMPGKG